MMKHTERFNERKRRLDDLTNRYSLWERIDTQSLNDKQISFLQSCMIENLNHARHAEIERLTFNTLYLAFVVGVITFAHSLTNKEALFIYFPIIIAGFLAMLLTTRWNNTFERHMFYAQQCYRLIHLSLFGDRPKDSVSQANMKEFIDGLEEIPMYSFRINRPIAYTFFGEKLYRICTKVLYNLFYCITQSILLFGLITTLLKVF